MTHLVLSLVLFFCASACAAPDVYDVRDFGAKGDGIAKDTKAIQSAIDAASRAGGGRVFLPAGIYLTGSIFLKSGIDFHVAAGATLKGSSDREDYNRWDVCPQNRRSKSECHEGGHLILCIEQHDVTLSGSGTIDGNGTAFAYGRDGRVARVHADLIWRPAQMIYFVESERVGVTGLKLRNAPYWTLLFHGCADVTVADLDVATSLEPLVHNGDGIAIDCCEHVSVSRCALNTSDDAIDLRANTKPLRHPRDCADITVKDCTISSGQDAIRLGVGDGRIRHARFEDIIVKRADKAAVNFSATWSPSPGVDFEDISFNRMTVTCPDFGRIHRLFATGDSVVRDISFSNIDARVERPMRIWARPGTEPFRNISFVNVNLRQGVEAFNVEGLRFEGGTAGLTVQNEEMRRCHEQVYSQNPRDLEDPGKPIIPCAELIRSDFAFDGVSGFLGWCAPEVVGGAAVVDLLDEKGPDGSSAVRFTGTAESCTFLSEPMELVTGESYRLSIKVRVAGYGRSAGVLGLRKKGGGRNLPVAIGIPGDTAGEWLSVEKIVKLPESLGKSVVFVIAADHPRTGATLDVAVPRLEPLTAKAKKESVAADVVSPIVGRVVPVEPLLAEVDATTGFMRFRANVPTNGCEIVATYDDGRPLGPMNEGRHLVTVKLVERESGKVRISNDYEIFAKMPVPKKKVGRRLNNFVVELVNVELKDGEYAFENPRRGWVWFDLGAAGRDAKGFLSGFGEPVLVWRDGEPLETLRYLEPGRYVLTVKGAAVGGRLRIHAVKTAGVGGNLLREEGIRGKDLWSRFGFEFCRRVAFASMTDVALWWPKPEHPLKERHRWVVDQLRMRGKRVFAISSCAPGASDARTSIESQRMLFADRQSFRDGYPVSYDENGLHMSMRDLNCVGEAAWEIAGKLDPRPININWYGIGGDTIRNFDPVLALLSANVNAGYGTGYLRSESYIGVRADPETLERAICNYKANQRALGKMMPAVAGRIVHNLSGYQQIGNWTSHLVPQVDRKVAMERFANRLATDPDFAEVGGLTFSAPRCGEELLRWGARLVHHYAIEGRTDSISESRGWRYLPETVADGDFEEGLGRWKAEPAEGGSLRGDSRIGFARAVERRNSASRSREGDSFAVFRRSAKAPNRLSQTVGNLVPGRRYVLEYAVANLADVREPLPEDRTPDLGIAAEIIGTSFDPGLAVIDVLGGKVKGRKPRARLLSVRHVFEAKTSAAELVFTDWASATDPGGEAGVELAVNYVAVTPYFEPAPGELEGDGTGVFCRSKETERRCR